MTNFCTDHHNCCCVIRKCIKTINSAPNKSFAFPISLFPRPEGTAVKWFYERAECDQSESETLEGHMGQFLRSSSSVPPEWCGVWSAVGHESTDSRRAGVDFDPDTAFGRSACVSVSVAQCKCETRNKFYDVFDGCLSLLSARLLVLLTPNPNPTLTHSLSLFLAWPGAHFRTDLRACPCGKSREILHPASCFRRPRPWLAASWVGIITCAVSNANKTFAPAIKTASSGSCYSFPS